MTRDHDIKRAIRARMKVTGESYTVARSALVAPTPGRDAQTTASQGGTVAPIDEGLLGELDQRGYAVLDGFVTPERAAELTQVVDDVIAAVSAAKQQEALAREAAGERRINVWYPGEPGWIAQDVSDRPEIRWLAEEPTLLGIAQRAAGTPGPLTRVRALAALPGYGHQGFHVNKEGLSPAFGSWDALVFVVILSPHRPETGTIRVLPGSHRSPVQFTEWGSAMPPHPDEVRIQAEPGDLFVYSGQLWKSSTFNGGQTPMKSMIVEQQQDSG